MSEECQTCSQGKALGRLEGKMDAVLSLQEAHGAKIDALDTRLRSVENRSAIAGAAAALMVTLGLDLVRWKLKA
jgi:hypothetical protein